MHELSLCRAIADTATEHADGRRIERIKLRVGHFRQVVPETLQFCWKMRTEGTDLAGCTLEVDHVAAVVECSDCGASTMLEHPVLRCGGCDGTDVTLTTGDEFLIESIEVQARTAAHDQEVH